MVIISFSSSSIIIFIFWWASNGMILYTRDGWNALLFRILSFHLFCFVSSCASCSCFFLKKEVSFSYLCERLTLKTIVVIVAVLPGEELLFDVSTSGARGLKPHSVRKLDFSNTIKFGSVCRAELEFIRIIRIINTPACPLCMKIRVVASHFFPFKPTLWKEHFRSHLTTSELLSICKMVTNSIKRKSNKEKTVYTIWFESEYS